MEISHKEYQAIESSQNFKKYLRNYNFLLQQPNWPNEKLADQQIQLEANMLKRVL